MHTTEIPQASWPEFLSTLSHCEAQHPVRIELAGPEVGDQILAEHLPLLGISTLEKGTMPHGIEVTLGPARDGLGNMTHYIAEPEYFHVQKADDGRVLVLDIEDRSQVKTLIFFE